MFYFDIEHPDSDNEKIKKAVERSRRYLIEPRERNRRATQGATERERKPRQQPPKNTQPATA